jgi:hypothetical protein
MKPVIVVKETDVKVYEEIVAELVEDGYKILHVSTDTVGGGDYVATRNWIAILVLPSYHPMEEIRESLAVIAGAQSVLAN